MTDEYTDVDESPDDSDEEDLIEAVVESDTVPRGQFEKVQREARSLRTKLRRTEFAREYGDEVVELVPESLSLKEQRELAAKLKDRLGTTAQTRTDEGTEPPATAAVEQPTEQERRAAALSREGTGSPPSGYMSIEDWQKLSVSDPMAAQAAFQAGKVNFAGLREGLGAAK